MNIDSQLLLNFLCSSNHFFFCCRCNSVFFFIVYLYQIRHWPILVYISAFSAWQMFSTTELNHRFGESTMVSFSTRWERFFFTSPAFSSAFRCSHAARSLKYRPCYLLLRVGWICPLKAFVSWWKSEKFSNYGGNLRMMTSKREQAPSFSKCQSSIYFSPFPMKLTIRY